MWPRRVRTAGVSEANQALISARIDLVRVKSREPKIERVAKEMLRIRERNHFAEQIDALMHIKEGERKGFL